jgi:hypothetical protein
MIVTQEPTRTLTKFPLNEAMDKKRGHLSGHHLPKLSAIKCTPSGNKFLRTLPFDTKTPVIGFAIIGVQMRMAQDFPLNPRQLHLLLRVDLSSIDILQSPVLINVTKAFLSNEITNIILILLENFLELLRTPNLVFDNAQSGAVVFLADDSAELIYLTGFEEVLLDRFGFEVVLHVDIAKGIVLGELSP